MKEYEIFTVKEVLDMFGNHTVQKIPIDVVHADYIKCEPLGFVLCTNKIVYVVPEGCGVRLIDD